MNTENKDQVVFLYLDDIIPNRFQPREVFDEKALKELAVSIKEHGVIQPIIVRNVKGKYEIIAGERRYKASALAGLTKIPAIIRDLDDKESSKVALLENLQRKNLTPIEEARTYQKILEIDEMTQEDLAKTMGKSQSAVANKLRLLSLSDEIQDAILKEQISERHARALLNIPDSQKQIEMLKKIISNKMSVRAVEDEIKALYSKEPVTGESITIPSVGLIEETPLLPNIPIEPTKDPIGTIKFIPPVATANSNEFINYGELNKKEGEYVQTMKFNNVNEHKDLDRLRSNSIDIAPRKMERKAPAADLDGLLNLQNMKASNYVNKFQGTANKSQGNDGFLKAGNSFIAQSSIPQSARQQPQPEPEPEEKEDDNSFNLFREYTARINNLPKIDSSDIDFDEGISTEETIVPEPTKFEFDAQHTREITPLVGPTLALNNLVEPTVQFDQPLQIEQPEPVEQQTKLEFDQSIISAITTPPEKPKIVYDASITENVPSKVNNNTIVFQPNVIPPAATQSADSVKKIRDAVAALRAQGVSVEYDEMNLDKCYQIIIRVEK